MGLTLTWSLGTIRAGSNHSIYGDDYDSVVSIIRTGDSIYLFGAIGELKLSDYRTLVRLLKKQGVKTISWERSNGKSIFKKL